MEIRTSTLKKGLWGALAVIILLGGGWLAYRAGLGGRVEAAPTPTPDDGRAAAIAGASAFLSPDVTAGMDAWKQAVCAVATENGCALVEVMGEGMWDGVVAGKVRSRYEVTASELYRDLGGGQQVWKLTGTIHDLNDPTQDKSGDLHVLTVKDGEGWKFDHILFTQEVKALDATPEVQP
ncbi:hypothetical protein ATHL_01012 [Anaerolinea thermolimosa]|uniref:hypothetical protein n=1 Tax=Anaerolinea thermolimosa TaxID=229919 RepID=UPI000783C44F|nr:hypothetical protein [Anaerolinea thermolimosa]GAP06166.1 hypothetical protein ATHL_01012 [Anaerolinea thermolimosa]